MVKYLIPNNLKKTTKINTYIVHQFIKVYLAKTNIFVPTMLSEVDFDKAWVTFWAEEFWDGGERFPLALTQGLRHTSPIKYSINSTVADPFHFVTDPITFRWITDPDPTPNTTWNRENTIFLDTFFFNQNIMLQKLFVLLFMSLSAKTKL